MIGIFIYSCAQPGHPFPIRFLAAKQKAPESQSDGKTFSLISLSLRFLFLFSKVRFFFFWSFLFKTLTFLFSMVFEISPFPFRTLAPAPPSSLISRLSLSPVRRDSSRSADSKALSFSPPQIRLLRNRIPYPFDSFS